MGVRKLHLGLSVSDLGRAAAFYRALLGVEPAKKLDDYVKFEADDPPIVLVLHPGESTGGGALNHVGFRVASAEALVAVQQRLEANGIRTEREEGVECCYSKQTKFWVTDADQNLWEIYTLEGDLDHAGFGGEEQPPTREAAERVVWEHRLTSPTPERIPHADGTVDWVNLEGAFNAGWSAEEMERVLGECRRVLREGGRISVHALVSDKTFPGEPRLPGPAAAVRSVPIETAPLRELQRAGFVGLNCERLGDVHCFGVEGVELRELQVSGIRPADDRRGLFEVVYRGPMRRVVDERGREFVRGRRTTVDEGTWRVLREAPFAEHFAFVSGKIAGSL